MRIAIFLIAFVTLTGTAHAQLKLLAEDSRAIQSCIKEQGSRNESPERCIGIIANPCLDRPDGQSTLGQIQCYQREHLVWDDILNESYRRLQEQLDGKLKTALRDMQRVGFNRASCNANSIAKSFRAPSRRLLARTA